MTPIHHIAKYCLEIYFLNFIMGEQLYVTQESIYISLMLKLSTIGNCVQGQILPA